MRHPTSLFRAVVGAVVIVSLAAPAQEWTRLRGPSGQGHGQADLPEVFAAEHVRWRVPIGGRGQSSPVLWGDHVYLTRELPAASDDDAPVRELVCFAAADGAELWSVADRCRPYAKHRFNSYASASATVDADGVYLAMVSGPEPDRAGEDDAVGTLWAAAWTHEGEARWRREIGPFHAMHGAANSAVLFEDLLIVPNENESPHSFIAALDKDTGEECWRLLRETAPGRATYAVPAVYRAPGGAPRLLVASTGHGLTSLDPRTGEIDWEIGAGFEERVVAASAIAGRYAILHAGSGGAGKECAVVRMPAAADEEPEIVYQVRRSIPYVPCAIADASGERLFLFSDGGIAQCIDAATGEEHWRQRLDGTFFSSPVLVADVVYIADRDGGLHSLRARGRFEVLGTFDLGAPVFATPAIARGSMFVRTEAELLRLGRAAR